MKNLQAVLALMSLIVIASAKEKKFPETWERCTLTVGNEVKRNKCIEKTMQHIILDLADNGNEDLGLGSLDPFKINHMVLDQIRENSPVKAKLEFKNMDLYGFKDVRISRALVKFSSPNDWYMRYDVKIPSITLISDYNVKGNILILPIVGNGKCNITFENAIARSDIHGSSIMIDGKEYLKLTNYTLDVGLNKFYMDLNNLFNGNQVLSDNMNRVLNENWDIIYQEMKPTMEKALSKQLYKYSRKILEEIPYKELFLFESE